MGKAVARHGLITPTHRIAFGLLTLVAVCFGHVCFAGFIQLDDPVYVTANSHVLGGLTWENVRWAFTESCLWAGFWVPVTWLTLQADASLWGPSGAAGFHLTNLMWHAVNSVLFFLVLQRMTKSLWLSAAAAALFAIHPLRVESVAWVTERKDVVSTAFLLLAIAAYQHYVEAMSWGRYLLVIGCFCLGLASKPMLVTFPFVLLLLDYWPLGRVRWGQSIPETAISRPGVSWKFLLVEKTPLFALSALVSALTVHFSMLVGAVSTTLPLPARLVIAVSGYLEYVEKSFYPVNLGVLYPLAPVPVGRVVLALVVLSASSAAVFYKARRTPALVVGWLWFLGTLFPVSGIVQCGPQALADRFTYVPHLGLACAVVWGMHDFAYWQQLSLPLQRLALGAVIALLGALSWLQVWYWETGERLFTHTLTVTTKNSTIHGNLAIWYHEHGNFERAEEHLAKAAEISPKHRHHRAAYAQILRNRQRHAEALAEIEAVIALQPDWPEPHYWLGDSLLRLGRRDEVRPHLEKAIALWDIKPNWDPLVGDLQRRRAEPHLALAELAVRAEEFDEALGHLDRALRIKPALAEALQLKGVAHGRRQHWSEAERAFHDASSLEPDNPSSRAYLAWIYARQNKNDLARKEYAALLRDTPDFPRKNAEFAVTLITTAPLRDVRLAEELAAQACEATEFKDARALNGLAAVQAAQGNYTKAVETAKAALGLTQEPALARELQEHLLLYERGQALPVINHAAK